MSQLLDEKYKYLCDEEATHRASLCQSLTFKFTAPSSLSSLSSLAWPALSSAPPMAHRCARLVAIGAARCSRACTR